MCSIFQLLPGFNIPYTLLYNAIHNNEHGYGILMKENEKIHVIKEMPEKVNPDAVFKILEDNKDIERWVHLRNRSEGDISIKNVQPIQVFDSNKRTVWFLHNGTIYGNQLIDESQKKFLTETLDLKNDSDSRRFAIGRLQPLLTRFKGAKGFGDIHDPFLQELLTSRWVNTNGRAVLVSSDQPALLFNSAAWETIKTDNGEFLASNNTYFDRIIRGTLFDQKKAEEDKKRGNVQQTTFGRTGSTSYGIRTLEYPPFEATFSFSEQIVNILEEYDIWSEEGYIALSFLEKSELEKLFKDNLEDAVILFMWLSDLLKNNIIEKNQLEDELKGANARIKALIAESWKNQQEDEAEVNVG